jgi:ABC-type iron transport system FetAB ATPase subunit
VPLEPTSALDAQTAKLVEHHLVSLPEAKDSNIKAVIWITHSDEQVKLGTRWWNIQGGVEERDVPAQV